VLQLSITLIPLCTYKAIEAIQHYALIARNIVGLMWEHVDALFPAIGDVAGRVWLSNVEPFHRVITDRGKDKTVNLGLSRCCDRDPSANFGSRGPIAPNGSLPRRRRGRELWESNEPRLCTPP
jgi:hypothetical protein